MAGNDYSFDPFELAEQELKERQLRATAQTLRAPPGPDNIMGQTMYAFDRGMAAVDQVKIKDDRAALQAKFSQGLAEALRNADPEVQALVSHPATRAQGLALLQKQQQRKLDREDDERDGMSGGGQPTYQQAVRMSVSSDPVRAAKGKQWLKVMEPMDPKNSGRIDPSTGNYGDIPGAPDAYSRQQRALETAKTPQGYQIPNGYGGTTTVGSTLPGATGQGFTPADASPAGSLPPPPPSPATSPNTPASGLGGALPGAVGASGGGAPPPPQVQAGPQGPDVQRMLQLLQDPTVPPPVKDQIAQQLGKMGVNFSANTGQQASPQEQAMAGPPAGGPPQALPGATRGVPQPNAGFGNTNPVAQDVYKDQARSAEDVNKEMQNKPPSGGAMLNVLHEMEAMNKKPTYSGALGNAAAAAHSGLTTLFPGMANDQLNNTMALDSQIQRSLGPMLKAYGYNPSNIDLISAEKSLPSIANTPQARQMIIEQIRRGVQAEEGVRSETNRRLDEGRRNGVVLQPRQVEEDVWREYHARRAQFGPEGQGSGNPTQPGSASALPGATASLNPDRPPTPPPAEGGGGAWAFAKDLGRNAVSFAQSLRMVDLSGKDTPGFAALKDTYGNIAEGIKQVGGGGDPVAWATAKDAQDQRKRSDPLYNQASIFHGIANPTSLIGGTATAIPKLALAGAVQGAIEPGTSYGDKVMSTLRGGALGTAFGTVAKGIPSKGAVGAINAEGAADDLLAKFPSFKPTSAQLNPTSIDSAFARGVGIDEAGALAQTQAITKDLMAKAGIPGETLTPKNIAAAHTALEKEATTLIPKGVKVKLASTDLTDLQGAIGGMNTAKTPTAQAMNAAQSHGSVAMTDLFTMYKEVANSGLPKAQADAARGAIEKLMARGMTPEQVQQFTAMNQRLGVLQDVERVWRGGAAEGVGAAAGYLNPAKIVNEAGTGPVSGAIEDAAQLIQRFGVRNYREGTIDGLYDAGKQIVKSTVGKAGYYVDQAINAIPMPKTMADLLRAGTVRGAPEVTKEIINAP